MLETWINGKEIISTILVLLCQCVCLLFCLIMSDRLSVLSLSDLFITLFSLLAASPLASRGFAPRDGKKSVR